MYRYIMLCKYVHMSIYVVISIYMINKAKTSNRGVFQVIYIYILYM